MVSFTVLGAKAHSYLESEDDPDGNVMLPSPWALVTGVVTSVVLEEILLGEAFLEAQRGQEGIQRLQSKMVPGLVLEASEFLPRPCFRVPKAISSSASTLYPHDPFLPEGSRPQWQLSRSGIEASFLLTPQDSLEHTEHFKILVTLQCLGYHGDLTWNLLRWGEVVIAQYSLLVAHSQCGVPRGLSSQGKQLPQMSPRMQGREEIGLPRPPPCSHCLERQPLSLSPFRGEQVKAQMSV